MSMLAAAVLVSLSCAPRKITNVTKFPWNAHDEKTLAYTRNRCVQVYKDAPCVKLFRKWGKQDYSVVCGAEVDAKEIR